MEKILIKDLKEGGTVDSVFLCAHKALLHGKNNKSYINIRLLDRSGQIETRIWDQAEALAVKFEKNDYVRVKGRVVEYQNHLQLNVFEIECVDPSTLNPADFLPTTQKNIPEMYCELCQRVSKAVKNPWIRQLMLNILEDPEISLLLQRTPAAKTFHHAWIGGLLEHILGLFKLGQDVLQHYPQVDGDLVLAGLLLHDLGKIDEIRAERAFEYTSRGQLIGHLMIGFEIVSEHAKKIPKFPHKVLGHLQHIILSHHGRLEYGSPKLPMTLEALMVHYLDDMDSKIQGFCDILAREGENSSEWTGMTTLFNRPLYKNACKDMADSVEEWSTKLSPTEKSSTTAPATQLKNSKSPLTSNLGEALQGALEKK